MIEDSTAPLFLVYRQLWTKGRGEIRLNRSHAAMHDKQYAFHAINLSKGNVRSRNIYKITSILAVAQSLSGSGSGMTVLFKYVIWRYQLAMLSRGDIDQGLTKGSKASTMSPTMARKFLLVTSLSEIFLVRMKFLSFSNSMSL